MRGNCPKCNVVLTAEDLRVNAPICPRCKTTLQVIIKVEWLYTILSFALAWVIASHQGYQSIVFAFWVLIYAAIILFMIKFYRWELHLPIKIVAVPDCQLWSRDAP